jgi:hypothetical protein
MAQINVNIDGKDHAISGMGDEHTECGLPVPMGLAWVTELTNPCSKCFPEEAKAAKAAKKATEAA